VKHSTLFLNYKHDVDEEIDISWTFSAYSLCKQ
jgi:hypothetical protein